MDLPYNNTRSKKNLEIIDFSVYQSSKNKKNLKTKKKKPSKKKNNDNSFIVNEKSSYKGLNYYLQKYEEDNNDKEYPLEEDCLKLDKTLKSEPVNSPEFIDNLTTSETKYINSLSKTDYDKYYKLLSDIFKIDDKLPFKFRILKSNNLDNKTKKYIIEKLDKFNCMEETDNEYYKLDDWISNIKKIPFDSYTLPDTINDYHTQILKCKEYLDKSVYGHEEAKKQIIQVFAQYLTNPKGNGKVLALQGPMGNGKTTLIKNGLSKALGKPFYFIGLGGATEASYLNGHSYTWEGARPGIIVQALQKNAVSDGVIYFDELDKVSKTEKGSEIYNCLCHITDNSQNSEYQDKYLQNIEIDLSSNMFVFSFNDKSKINPILLDRLNIINTKGFNNSQKIEISNKYLIPEICLDVGFDRNNIIINKESIEYIINNFTKEEGVRTLKKSLEKIISYFNLIKLLPENENLGGLIKISNKKFPVVLDSKMIDIILMEKNNNYMVDSLYI